jgi:hypothetical protein
MFGFGRKKSEKKEQTKPFVPEETQPGQLEERLLVRNLDNERNITTSYRVAPSPFLKSAEILMISFSGIYERGSAGHKDAMYILGKIHFALYMTEAIGIIIDLRELKYVWGNEMNSIIGCSFEMKFGDVFPAIIVGPHCHKAIASLGGKRHATDEEHVFETFDEAWQYVKQNIEQWYREEM